MTLDVFLGSDGDYERLLAARVLTPEGVGHLYGVDPDRVLIFEVPQLRVVKISFPRLITAGSFEDGDQRAGQQYLPLSGLELSASSNGDRPRVTLPGNA